MDENVMKLIDLLVNQNNYQVVFILVIAMILFKLQVIYDFIERQKSSKIKMFDEYAKLQNLSDEMKKHLADNIDSEVFRITTGINTSKTIRELLIKFYNEANGDFSFRQFKIAQSFFVIKDKKLVVKTTIWDYCGFVFNAIGFSLLLIISIALFKNAISINELTVFEAIVMIILGVIAYVLSGLMLILTFPLIQAKLIDKYLENNPVIKEKLTLC